MYSFASSVPRYRSPKAGSQQCRIETTRTQRRRKRPSLSMAPPKPGRALKNRSIIALRGLSDLGSVTVIHELAAWMVLPTTLSSVVEAHTQLLFGGLVGIWTAASLAERLREESISRIRDSRLLPDRWDAAFLYSPDIMDDEVADAVAWLYAFDELEGSQARELMHNMARNGEVSTRLRLVHALASVPAASNIVDSVLTKLLDDEEAGVRSSAQDALTRYHENAERYDIVTQNEGAQMSAVLERILGEPNDAVNESIRRSGMMDRIAERVEFMGCVALSKPDLRKWTGGEDDVVDVEARVEKVEVPLFEGLRWSELHGICALALIPAGYELFSMVDGGNLPLRFVGLGWLLTVGGMAAYPQSGMLWRRFATSIDRAHYEDSER